MFREKVRKFQILMFNVTIKFNRINITLELCWDFVRSLFCRLLSGYLDCFAFSKKKIYIDKTKTMFRRFHFQRSAHPLLYFFKLY